MPFKMHKIIYFFQKNIKKKYVPTLPKIFRPVTLNTLNFYLALVVTCGLGAQKNNLNRTVQDMFWLRNKESISYFEA